MTLELIFKLQEIAPILKECHPVIDDLNKMDDVRILVWGNLNEDDWWVKRMVFVYISICLYSPRYFLGYRVRNNVISAISKSIKMTDRTVGNILIQSEFYVKRHQKKVSDVMSAVCDKLKISVNAVTEKQNDK